MPRCDTCLGIHFSFLHWLHTHLRVICITSYQWMASTASVHWNPLLDTVYFTLLNCNDKVLEWKIIMHILSLVVSCNLFCIQPGKHSYERKLHFSIEIYKHYNTEWPFLHLDMSVTYVVCRTEDLAGVAWYHLQYCQR